MKPINNFVNDDDPLDHKFETENLMKDIQENKLSGEEAIIAVERIRENLRKFPYTEVPEAIKLLKQDLLKLAPKENRYELLKDSIQRKKKSGTIAEFGVFKGQSLIFMAETFPELSFVGFDIFEGGVGFSAPANAQLIPGHFKDSIPDFTQEISVIHIDPDTYESAREVLFCLNDKIKKDTIIQFDELLDYNSTANEKWLLGEWKAVDEWANAFNRKYQAFGRDTTCRGSIIVLE